MPLLLVFVVYVPTYARYWALLGLFSTLAADGNANAVSSAESRAIFLVRFFMMTKSNQRRWDCKTERGSLMDYAPSVDRVVLRTLPLIKATSSSPFGPYTRGSATLDCGLSTLKPPSNRFLYGNTTSCAFPSRSSRQT